ncbi:EboA domain-containing protein [Kineosporia babensis]|uniref:EboA domain-containing protein n=1 Tax=Kineosporia babensis TaxID=499548 RepID=A0A9X1T099_9ACTN|nr:EboA domain-containing protein [Kineosporia babensis]MCD5312478.1 EboA domain-containing protein [Kineosporia babensis]
MTWLDNALQQIQEDPTSIRKLFPMATRKAGPEHEAARIKMLAELPDQEEIPDLYRYGDVNEKRAVILAIAERNTKDQLLDLARDAFRSNDPRLVTASAAPGIVQNLSDEEADQLLMKCLFMGIPLDRVPAITGRSTARTAEMAANFVLERVCAGRDVSPDVWPIIDQHPPAEVLNQIEEQLASADPERRKAAAQALNQRGKV